MKFTAQTTINWSKYYYSEPMTKRAVINYYCHIYTDLTPELKERFIRRLMTFSNDRFIADFNKIMNLTLTACGPNKFRFRYEK